MFSCFFSTPQQPTPLFKNSLLSDPTIRLNETKWDARYYDMKATASLVIFVAISIFAISYSAFLFPEYIYHVVTTSMMVFPSFFSIIYSPYKALSIQKSEEFAFEALTNLHIKNLKSKDPSELESLHREIGAESLSTELQTYMKKDPRCTNPHETLIPIYARALAYNDLAQAKLKEIHDVFTAPAKPLNNRKIEQLNYQELLALNNNPDASVDQKIVGNRLRNNRLTNRFNLETSYLEYRVKSIQMASIASNPIHPGIHGSYVTPMNIVEFENQKRYEELPTSGAFIRFLSSNRGITLDSFFNSYTTCVENLFNAYINKFDKTKFDLNPTEWKELTAFFQENFLDKEHLSPIEKKNLLNDPYISKFVHRNSAKELTAIFSKYDPYKLENHILSFLLSQKSEPQGLDLVISDADKNNREIFLGEIKTNPNPCSLLERAIENDTLQRVVGEITSRFYTQFSPVSAS